MYSNVSSLPVSVQVVSRLLCIDLTLPGINCPLIMIPSGGVNRGIVLATGG
jgi:hypothetical protein